MTSSRMQASQRHSSVRRAGSRVGHRRVLLLGTLLTLPLQADFARGTQPSPAVCSRTNLSACLNGVTSAVLAPDSLRVTGPQTDARTRSRLRQSDAAESAMTTDGQSGLAAGDVFSNLGGWADYSRDEFRSDVSVAPYRAGLSGFTVGVDRLFMERVFAGLALGYERTRSTTFYNGGGQETEGVLVLPYAAVLLTDVLTLDASAGYASLTADQNRIDPTNGATLTADYASTRWHVASNLNASVDVGAWTLGARVGALYSTETQDAYRESGGPRARSVGERTVALTQGVAAGDVSRRIGALEAYGALAYRYDFDRASGRGAGGLPVATGATQSGDKDEIEFGLGLRYSGAMGVTSTVEWLKTLDRQRFDNDAVRLGLRLDL